MGGEERERRGTGRKEGKRQGEVGGGRGEKGTEGGEIELEREREGKGRRISVDA